MSEEQGPVVEVAQNGGVLRPVVSVRKAVQLCAGGAGSCGVRGVGCVCWDFQDADRWGRRG